MNEKRKIRISFKYVLFVTLIWSLVLIPQAQAVDDYFLYVNWNPNVGYTTGVQGYVDTNGDLGDEYLIFAGGPSYCGHHTAYIYRVDTTGDPNMHPDNPETTCPVSPRTSTLEPIRKIYQ